MYCDNFYPDLGGHGPSAEYGFCEVLQEACHPNDMCVCPFYDEMPTDEEIESFQLKRAIKRLKNMKNLKIHIFIGN